MTLTLKPLHRGTRSEAGRKVQAATKRRLRARDLDALADLIVEDGDVGAKTLEAVRKAAWALGARPETYEAITQTGVIPIGVQRMVLNPGRRTERQRESGRRRMAQLRRQRKRRAAMAKKPAASARTRTVNAFLAKVGTVERPAGSNGGGIITVMQTYWGFGRVPWCGISEGYHAVRFGGMQGLRSDVASVAAIENHARAKHSPYGHWQDDIRSLLPASFLVIGGFGVHTGMKVDDAPLGGAKTVEGNTSFGPGGNQANGGCIAARVRSNAEIRGGAAMNYPG
jgi:hypothetical protein